MKQEQEKIYSIPNPVNPSKPIQIRMNGDMNRDLKYAQEQYKRGIEAAEMGRLLTNWRGSTSHINDEIMKALRITRERSREQSHNSPIARAYYNIVENNIVGPNGFTLKVNSTNAKGVLNTRNNDLVEAMFRRWSKVCDKSRRNDFKSMLSLVVRGVAREGEVLIRKHYFKPTKENPFGFALQLLNIDVLDTDFNAAEKNGIRVVMGVELDQFDCITAYYLNQDHTASYSAARQQKRVRVPVDEIYHVFFQEYPEQARGLPWMRGAMKAVHHLESYEEYARIAARAAASHMGFFTTTEDGAGGIETLADQKTDVGDFLSNLEPGVLQVLPKGYNFQKFDPAYPAAMLGDFIKSQKRSIANALSLCYNSLFGDLENVNYSSIRQNLVSEREMYKGLHAWLCNSLLNSIYQDFLREGFKNNAFIDRQGYQIPDFEIDSLMDEFHFTGRSWSWIDPKNDMEAAKIAIEIGTYTPERIAEMQGEDFHTNMVKTAAIRDEAKKLDIYIYKINDPEANALAAAEKEARQFAAQQAAANAQLAQQNAQAANDAQAKSLQAIDERMAVEVRALQQQVELSRNTKQGDINVTPTVKIEPAAVNVTIGTTKRTKTNVLRDERGLVVGMETVVYDESEKDEQSQEPVEQLQEEEIAEVLNVEIQDEIEQVQEVEEALDAALEQAETVEEEAANVA